MKNREIKNAVIKDTMLGYEHGTLTFMLTLDYGGTGQGAGGYGIDGECCSKLIMKILDIVGVKSWEELKGKHIKAECEHFKVFCIGNILKDKWLCFEDFFKEQYDL